MEGTVIHKGEMEVNGWKLASVSLVSLGMQNVAVNWGGGMNWETHGRLWEGDGKVRFFGVTTTDGHHIIPHRSITSAINLLTFIDATVFLIM